MGLLVSKDDVANAAALVKILTRSLLLQERRPPGSIMAKALPKPAPAAAAAAPTGKKAVNCNKLIVSTLKGKFFALQKDVATQLASGRDAIKSCRKLEYDTKLIERLCAKLEEIREAFQWDFSGPKGAPIFASKLPQSAI